MEKFEKHIREKLEARKIEPSKGAWERIATKVSAHPAPQAKKKYGYMVAAAIIGVFMVSGIFFFMNDGEALPAQQVVVEQEKAPQEVQIVNKVEKVTPVPKESTSEPLKTVINNEEPESRLAETMVKEPIEPKDVPIENLVFEGDTDVIALKVNEVVKQVELLEEISNAEVSDVEVDSLLRAAQKEIIKERLFNKEGKVDAMALLFEVEDELDESFRDQIFDALKQGYFKLRTAVADRNK